MKKRVKALFLPVVCPVCVRSGVECVGTTPDHQRYGEFHPERIIKALTEHAVALEERIEGLEKGLKNVTRRNRNPPRY